MLTITQLTHKQAYRDIGVITVIIPVAVTLLMLVATALADTARLDQVTGIRW